MNLLKYKIEKERVGNLRRSHSEINYFKEL